MSKGKIPLWLAAGLAKSLITKLEPYCERIAVAGSIRRKRDPVGDIEIVAIPKLGENLFGERDHNLDHLTARLFGMITDGMISKLPEFEPEKTRGAWGPKYKKFFITGNGQELQVDLFCCDVNNWGNMITIRTGSSEFSAALMSRIKNRTPYRQNDGYLMDSRTGKIIPVATERDFFSLAGVGWVNPENRQGREQVRTVPTRMVINRTAPEPKDKTVIKAITVHQPWASLIAAGLKEYETRSWETGYRGLIAIHAGKTKPKLNYADFGFEDDEPDPMPLGAVVAVAKLVNCTLTSQLLDEDKISIVESEMGNWSKGRYGWQLKILKRFDEPIPARGQQGLWDWDGWDGVIDDQKGNTRIAPTGNISSATAKNDTLPARVIHNKTGPFDSGLDGVYIGRPGKWGNPFKVGKDGDRTAVIKKYARYLRENPKLIRMAQDELRGRDLRCWCYPEACHGEVLIQVANSPVGEVMYTTDEDVRTAIRARLEKG